MVTNHLTSTLLGVVVTYVGSGVALEGIRASEVAHFRPRKRRVVKKIALRHWNVQILHGCRVGLSGRDERGCLSCTPCVRPTNKSLRPICDDPEQQHATQGGPTSNGVTEIGHENLAVARLQLAGLSRVDFWKSRCIS
jgi:hypothetical protein